MFTYFILIWGIASIFLAFVSIYKIKANKQRCDFTWWWAFPIGAFVWEDALIFGILHFLLALVSLLSKSNMLWVVAFLVFWIIRSAGETLYFFLQQFIVPVHHPHDISAQLTLIRRLFGDISDQKIFILLQVSMQSILVLSLLCLIILLKKVSF